MILIAYFPVAAGSPGPLDKNIPRGLRVKIFLAGVLQETIVTVSYTHLTLPTILLV